MEASDVNKYDGPTLEELQAEDETEAFYTPLAERLDYRWTAQRDRDGDWEWKLIGIHPDGTEAVLRRGFAMSPFFCKWKARRAYYQWMERAKRVNKPRVVGGRIP
jgi:hypothetical protein